MGLAEKRLFVIRGVPLNQDSRTLRHLRTGSAFKRAITWEDEGVRTFGLYTGRKQYPIALSYTFWLLRLFITSLAHFRKGDTVICMDLDTYLPVRLGGLFGGAEIYFDIVDPIAQTRFRRLKFNKLFDWIEFAIVRYSRRVIIPGPSRIDYYFDRLGLSREMRCLLPTPIIIENVATFCEEDRRQSLEKRGAKLDQGPRMLAYFGGLTESRGLHEMCSHFAGSADFRVLIAGRGPLEAEVSWWASEFDNIEYTGAFHYDQLSNMMTAVDFFWAYYSPQILLHSYAYPNKFYEHLAFRVPIIINRCVPQSTEVARLGTGIVIEDELTDGMFRNLRRKMQTFDTTNSDFFEWERAYQHYNFSLDGA